ncbi:MAG: glycoside hydrolase family 6 protein [Myxococcota bacterium]|nr:glycoside hydrolase family 6 protein [Myxococcota bacterium]
MNLAIVPCVIAAAAASCGGSTQPANVPTSASESGGSLPAPAATGGSPSTGVSEPPSSLPPPVAATEAKAPVQVTPPAPEGNPFANARFYISPGYVAKVEASIKASPADAALLKKVESYPTAVWLSSIKAVSTVSKTLDDALAQQKKGGTPVVTVFAIYDLPERDCAASASNGELTIANGGEKKYEREFIDKIAAAFKAHPGQRIVAIVEPDSLANLATNMNIPKCAAADPAYRHSIAYAVKTLSMPNVSLYLDAAHAGWLGWSKNREKIAKIFSEVLTEAGGADKVRGFATNVSNYDTLTPGDLAKLEPSDPCPDELTYVKILDTALSEAGIAGKGFVIDTSRNGRSGIRTKAGSWCNVKGAGLGERPRATPAPLVDAYFWIKPPGEADGGSDSTKSGFDENCGPKSPDSEQGAPPAGEWFGKYFIELARNANPSL